MGRVNADAADFNNLLQVIIGYSDMLMVGKSPALNEEAQDKIEEIGKAGHRAADSPGNFWHLAVSSCYSQS